MTKQAPLVRLAEYKQAIDADIAAYAAGVRAGTRERFGTAVLEAETEVFLDILGRGGKRLRGALVMAGYEMCGGVIDLGPGTFVARSTRMIVQAARAIEMLHAYLLIIDDIQDRSALRRGHPSAHRMLAAYHRAHQFKGDAAHSGLSLALNAAGAGTHAAQTILANLDARPELRLKVLDIINQTAITTFHGQTLDILNELADEPDEVEIERVLEWKTARYTVVNPLQVDMTLAGADDHALAAITPYGLHAGKAFQITDDILGIFGDETALGKTPGDDIREGKGTLLTLHALRRAAPADKTFLQNCLGNPGLTSKDFQECQNIIENSGALAHARQAAVQHLGEALAELDKADGLWSQAGTDFLRTLTHTLQDRMA